MKFSILNYSESAFHVGYFKKIQTWACRMKKKKCIKILLFGGGGLILKLVYIKLLKQYYVLFCYYAVSMGACAVVTNPI